MLTPIENYDNIRKAVLDSFGPESRTQTLRQALRTITNNGLDTKYPDSIIKYVALDLIDRGELEMLPDLSLRLPR